MTIARDDGGVCRRESPSCAFLWPAGKMAYCNLVRELRAKDLAILLSCHFEVIRLLLLTLSFSLRAFLLL
jgi:hypothetical protein